ncbi:MAG: replication initiator protein A [Chitinivibrionales bacterium]|nr:replication initiator protein A [Chitinivibrionales bacterium]
MNQKKDPEPLSKILESFNFPSAEEEKNIAIPNVPIAVDDDDDNDILSKPTASAYDINFAEFPLAYLNTGKLPDGVSKTRFEYKDIINGPGGKPVERHWTIEARATEKVESEEEGVKKNEIVQLGFGGPSTLELIYELFQIWKEQGFKENKIHIGSYYYLLKRLGWGTGKAQYVQLQRTLNCLNGLHIDGQSCFYNPIENKFENQKFHPFPRINTYTSNSKSASAEDYLYVTVDEEFFKTVKSKSVYYIPFDRFYFKKLKPMEQKIALMLAKIFSPYRKNKRFEWKRNIYELSNQIPILATDGSQIRRQLKRICDGLTDKDFPFLSSYKIDDDIITFFNNMQTKLNLLPSSPDSDKKDYDSIEWLIKEQLKVCGDEHSRAFYTLVAKHVPVDMIYRALSEAKQEGKIKRKLYTKLIMERAKKYLDPYLKKSSKTDDSVELSEEEKKQINLDLLKEQEEFAKRIANHSEPEFTAEEIAELEKDNEENIKRIMKEEEENEQAVRRAIEKRIVDNL